METCKDDDYCFHESKFLDQNGVLQTTKVPVVQELARRGLKDLPHRFRAISPPSDHPEDLSGSDFLDTFAAIDVSKLKKTGPESAQELAKLAGVAKTWGMFLIINHGVSSSVVEDVKDVVTGFFGLSFEEKKASVGTYMSTDNVGYGRNFVKSEEQPLDWIDRLAMKAAPKEATEGLRVWPQNPPNFRQAVEKYVDEARKTCDELLQFLAEALSLETHVFLRHFDCDKREVNVRVNFYPPCPRPDLTLGIVPHTDGSVLTLLTQFGASKGLQVFKDTKWFTMPWPENTLLVSFGDLLEIMSNGRLKSPWHRAVTSFDSERISVALFYNPPSDAEIEVVEDDEGSGGGGCKDDDSSQMVKGCFSAILLKKRCCVAFLSYIGAFFILSKHLLP